MRRREREKRKREREKREKREKERKERKGKKRRKEEAVMKTAHHSKCALVEKRIAVASQKRP